MALRSAQRLATNYPDSAAVKALNGTGHSGNRSSSAMSGMGRSSRGSWALPSSGGALKAGGKVAVRDVHRPGTAGAVMVGGARAGMAGWAAPGGVQLSGSLGSSGGGSGSGSGYIRETGH